MKILIRLVLASLIIVFILWNRLLRIRTPGPIENIGVTKVGVLLLVCFVILCLISIIININVIVNGMAASSTITKLFPNILKPINMFMDSPKYIYNYVADKLINLRNIIELPASYLAVYFCYPRLIVALLILLPRVVVATCFLLDITYFHYLHHFYKLLVILIIPLITTCYIHMIYFHGLNHIEFAELYLDITYANCGLAFNLKAAPPQIKDALTIGQMKSKFLYMIDSWRINTVLKRYAELLYEAEGVFKPYVSVYTSTCFLIGWSYLLFTYI